ncbi:MAG: GcrA family cell cycle regulator, partial [Pseudomonadota bacterium]
MAWTEERVDVLKRLWADGKSASQIANELGGVTRNAVIGKAHRLGLSNRTKGSATVENGRVASKQNPEPKDGNPPEVKAE